MLIGEKEIRSGSQNANVRFSAMENIVISFILFGGEGRKVESNRKRAFERKCSTGNRNVKQTIALHLAKLTLRIDERTVSLIFAREPAQLFP